MSRKTWDMGDPEPSDEVMALEDYSDWDQFSHDSNRWGRTVGAWKSGPGKWKGYKNGDRVYLDWEELVRRWGPLTEESR